MRSQEKKIVSPPMFMKKPIEAWRPESACTKESIGHSQHSISRLSSEDVGYAFCLGLAKEGDKFEGCDKATERRATPSKSQAGSDNKQHRR